MGERYFAIIVGLAGLLIGLLAAACEHEGKPAAVVPTRGHAPVPRSANGRLLSGIGGVGPSHNSRATCWWAW